MAIFSDKIVSAKFINNANNVIEVLYAEGDQIIPYVLEVNYSDNNFKDLIEEYPLEQIQANTEQQKKVFRDLIETRVRQEVRGMGEEKILLSILNEKADDLDFIFEFKIVMLDSELVSSLDDKKIKAKIRKSKNLFELLSIYGDIKANS